MVTKKKILAWNGFFWDGYWEGAPSKELWDLDWLKDDGSGEPWGVIINANWDPVPDDLMIGTHATRYTEAGTLHYSLCPPMEELNAKGIDVWVGITNMLIWKPGVIERSNVASDYDVFLPVIEALESEWGPDGTYGNCLKGYWCEFAYDNGWTWLYNYQQAHNKLEMIWGIYGDHWLRKGSVGEYDMYSPIGTVGEAGIDSFNRRCTQSTEINIEVWSVEALTNGPDTYEYDLWGCIDHIRNTYPSLPIGMDTTDRLPPFWNRLYNWSSGNSYNWWTIRGGDDHGTPISDSPTNPVPSYELCRNRYASYFKYAKNVYGPFESIICEPTPLTTDIDESNISMLAVDAAVGATFVTVTAGEGSRFTAGMPIKVYDRKIASPYTSHVNTRVVDHVTGNNVYFDVSGVGSHSPLDLTFLVANNAVLVPDLPALFDTTTPTFQEYVEEACAWMDSNNLTDLGISIIPTISTDCQIRFEAWPSTGTSITNAGLLGGVGTAEANHYKFFITTNRLSGWDYSAGGSGYIRVPQQPSINNLSDCTFEFNVFYRAAVTAGAQLFSKQSTTGYFQIYIDNNGELVIERSTTNSNSESWTTAGYALNYTYKDGFGWHTEVVDGIGDAGSYCSLALNDTTYLPSISYYDTTNGNLKYAYKDGTGWHAAVVDITGDVGQYSSLKLAPTTNLPSICYYDVTNTKLKYAYNDGTWHTETVDATAGVGQYCSFAFNPVSGYPGVAYYDAVNGHLKYAYKDGTGWHAETADSSASVGKYCSFAYTTGGVPGIAYYDEANGDLKYTYKSGSWTPSTVDSTGDVGRYASLTLSSGMPGISYYDATNQHPKYAYKSGSWVLATVDSVHAAGLHTSVSYNPVSGYPLISYWDVTGRYLYYSYKSDAGWSTPQEPVANKEGAYSSIQLGEISGVKWPAICYYYGNNGLRAAPNTWYDVQLTWDSGTGPTNTPPICTANETDFILTRTASGTGSWSPDGASDVYIGNQGPALTKQFNGVISAVRVHDAILPSQDLLVNRYSDQTRDLSIAPSATTTTTEPSIGLGKVQSVVPTATTTTTKPSIGLGNVQSVVPTATTTTTEPSVGYSTGQSVVPSATTTTTKPSIGLGKVQSVVPSATTTAIKPAIKIGKSLLSPSATTTATKPLVGVGKVQSVVPAAITTVTKPSLGISTTLTSPTATALANKPLLGELAIHPDYITVPHGAAVDDLPEITIEFLFCLNGMGEAKLGRLFSKTQANGREFMAYVNTGTMQLCTERGTTNSPPYDFESWATPSNSLELHKWYHVQIMWSDVGTEPTVVINGEPEPLSHLNTGTGSWSSDAGHDIILGNNANGIRGSDASVVVFRVYSSKLSLTKCQNNYWGDYWRLVGQYEIGYVSPGYQPPLLQIGKNVSELDTPVDYSEMITHLYARGSGSSPSELLLDTPRYYPVPKALKLTDSDNVYAYFDLPDAYSSYDTWSGNGFTLDDVAVFDAGTGTFVQIVSDYPADGEKFYAVSFGYSNHCAAQTFQIAAPNRIFDIWLLLGRSGTIGKEYIAQASKLGAWPRLVVGVFNTTKSALPSKAGSAGAWSVPWQGPLVSSSIDIRSVHAISNQTSYSEYAWHRFPMQSDVLGVNATADVPAEYAVVAYVSPSLDLGAAPISLAQSPHIMWMLAYTGSYSYTRGRAYVSYAGAHPDAWGCPAVGETIGGAVNDQGYGRHFTKINMAGEDLTTQFQQGMNAHKLRQPLTYYDPSKTYNVYYRQSPYLCNWESYDTYGKIEGTYKDDALKSQDCLFKAGSEYLKKISVPKVTLNATAVDLYELDPFTNWTDELKLGSEVLVMDDAINLSTLCTVKSFDRSNLNSPHDIKLTFDNVTVNAPSFMSKLQAGLIAPPKYISGQTVSTPYVMSTMATYAQPATMLFEISEATSLVQSVDLSMDLKPFQIAGSSGLNVDNASAAPGYYYRLEIDDSVVKYNFGPSASTDILPYITKNHTGQPTPGWHKIKITPGG